MWGCCLFFYALSFNIIIHNGGISFRSGNDGFICWRSLGMVIICLACMVQRFGCAIFSSLSSFCLSFPQTLPELTCYNITAFPFLLLSHHLLDTLSLFISPTSFSFSATRVSMVPIIILINLWSLGSSPLGITSISFMLTSSSFQLTHYCHIKVFFYIPLV